MGSSNEPLGFVSISQKITYVEAFRASTSQEHHTDGIDPSDLARLAACGAGGWG